MFCENCGNKIIENTQFCHNCGSKISDGNEDKKTPLQNSKSDNKPMTREEYMAHTNIKSEEEAKEYLHRLNFLFIAVFIGIVIVRGGADSIDEGLYAILWLADIALLIYFVWYCVKVIKAEKISKASAVFSIIFAPISWFWFYPDITDPLKIILGKKVPPISLPSNLSSEEKKKKDKKFWRNFWIIMGSIFGALILILILISLLS
jgi:uncharacterized membrane protein YvbJ